MQTFPEEVLVTFTEETRERLDTIEETLIRMERAGADAPEMVHSIFRDAHSIKAGANLLEFRNIETLAHRLENILDMVREGKLVPDEDMVTVLLQAVDKLRELSEDPTTSNEADITLELASLDAAQE